jgi:hypothetical protein
MGENAAFGLGFLRSLGQAALTDREERRKREREERELNEETNARKLGMLQKLVEADNLLPDEARNAAATHLFRLATSEKTKPKDYEQAMSDVMALASRPRPTPKTVAADAVRQSADANVKLPSAPGSLWGTMVPRLPSQEDLATINSPREMTSGMLSRDEITARQDADMSRRLAMQQSAMKPQYFEVNPGARLVDASGKLIAEGNAPTPKQDFSRTPFEVLMDPNATPEQKMLAERAMTLQFTNQGDQTRTGAGGGAGGGNPRYQRQVFQKPDGTYTEVLTNPYDPSEPPIRRDFGGGIDKPMSDATKNARAQTQGTIAMLQGVLEQLDSGQVNPDDVFGKMNELKYRVQSSGWVPFMGTPDETTSNVRTDLANFNNELVKLRSGAAVSAQEWSRLQKELPIAGMAPDEVVTRIRRTVERLQRIFDLRYGPNGVGDANAFPGDVEGQSAAPGPATAAPAPAPAPAPGRLPPPPPPTGYRPRGSIQ